MRLRTLAFLAAATIGFGMPQGANAQVVAGQWYQFVFGGVGSSNTICGGICTGAFNPVPIDAPAAWTYNSATGGTFTLLDGFLSGGRFDLRDFGVTVGSTSPSSPGTGNCGGDITLCLNTPEISKGIFAFGAGAHSWSSFTTQSPTGSGSAFFRVDATVTTVPEPGTYALVTMGLVAVAYARRRRV